jgi:hypothetical protein
LLLNELPSSEVRPRRAYTITAPARATPGPTETLDFPLQDVSPGQYLARVQVDGAESQLAFDEVSGRYNAPSLTIP